MFSPVYLSGMVFSIRLVFIISITTADGGIGGKWYLSQEHSQDNASPDSITSVSSACVNSTGRPAVQICFLRKISCTVINFIGNIQVKIASHIFRCDTWCRCSETWQLVIYLTLFQLPCPTLWNHHLWITSVVLIVSPINSPAQCSWLGQKYTAQGHTAG